ncbi:hybrid sensor histidine kinase/response regulator [Clostridium transplantifaecale]|uniref:hybrid sensor histidine kinase/response regulator n=1 Tax=Clostridium transplantifaecale TaxID=2479838 RepID=UPI001FAA9839|nr:hybrid sensor histidine kinase/response regulator [Clostridium transplantifaecale]
MKHRKSSKWYLVLLPVFLIISAVLVSYFLTVRKAMYTESSEHLNEVSQQMATSLNKQALDQWRLLDMIYHDYRNSSSQNMEAFSNTIREQQETWGFDSLCFVDENATYYDSDNHFSLLSQENVTDKLLMQQKPVILDNVIFEDTRKLIFLEPIPEMQHEDTTFRAIGFTYNSENIFDILNIEAFNGQALLYIVHGDGVVLFRSEQDDLIRGYNLFNSLAEDASFQRGSVQLLRDTFSTEKRALMTVSLKGSEYYLNHTPIGVDDWQLIMLVPVDAVSGRIKQVSVISFVCLSLVGGLIIAAFIVIHTTSTKKVLKAEEEARMAAESANLAKSQFLSNMSHDIRTPMNAITGMAKIATDHINEPDVVTDCLKKISLSGRLLVNLINDILDMSKIESGKMSLNNSTGSLADVIDNVVSITQPTVQQKNQDFNIRVHDLEHENLSFDALRLNQVLINLLGNAVKFTPEGGSISLDVTECPSEREGFAHFVFRVSDTGIGMSPEFLTHLFDSFSRERDRRVDRIEGSGLGMAITKMIVTMMDGNIAVESKPDHGSVFTIDLDLCVAEEPDKLSLPAMKVLVADDDRDTRISAVQFLQELGIHVDTADDGESAVQMALAAHAAGADYQVIFLDWKMPGLDGVSAARAIREQICEEIPILMVSAYDWSSIESQAAEACVNGFVQKPFFKSTLYNCIQKYVLHQNESEDEAESFKLTGRHILLAEDNEINREIAVTVLADLGAVVDEAQNGLEAVEAFRHSAPGYYDLILMDLQMPVMDGCEAARTIRRLDREDAESIPIFAVTADAFTEDIELVKKAGMNSHLAKPLNVPVMLKEIQKYLHL